MVDSIFPPVSTQQCSSMKYRAPALASVIEPNLFNSIDRSNTPMCRNSYRNKHPM